MAAQDDRPHVVRPDSGQVVVLIRRPAEPSDVGAVRGFLTHLAVERRVAAATQNQALNALVFLYREVIGGELGSLGKIERPTQTPKVPTVLTKDEVRRGKAGG